MAGSNTKAESPDRRGATYGIPAIQLAKAESSVAVKAAVTLDADLAAQLSLLQVVNGEAEPLTDADEKVNSKGKGKEKATDTDSNKIDGIRYDGGYGRVEPSSNGTFANVILTDCTIIGEGLQPGLNLQNCALFNVTFEYCTFTDVIFTDIVLKNTKYVDCEFSGFTWMYDQLVESTVTEQKGKTFEGAKLGFGTPKLNDVDWLDVQRATLQKLPTVDDDAAFAARLQSDIDQEDRAPRDSSPGYGVRSSFKKREKNQDLAPPESKLTETELERAEAERAKMMDQWAKDWYGADAKFSDNSATNTSTPPTPQWKEFKAVESEAERRAVKKRYDESWYETSSHLTTPSDNPTKPATVPHFKLGVTERRELSAANIAKLNSEQPSPAAKQSVPQRVNAKLEATPPHLRRTMQRSSSSPLKASPTKIRHDSPMQASPTPTAPPVFPATGSPQTAPAGTAKRWTFKVINEEDDDLIDLKSA